MTRKPLGQRTFFAFLLVAFALFAYRYVHLSDSSDLHFESQEALLSTTRYRNCKKSMSNSCDTALLNEATIPDLSVFSFNLFYHVSNNLSFTPNVLISPFSIAAIMSLVVAGATIDSNCQSEILSALSTSSHVDLPKLSLELSKFSTLDNKDVGVKFTSGNGIWVRSSLKEDYVTMAKGLHQAQADNIPKTYEPINSFISDKTNGMISNMLQGEIDPLTVAILVNAVYFKGMWSERFDPKKTKLGVFRSRIAGGESVDRDAQFMKMEKRMLARKNMAELGGATMVSLEYETSGGTNENAMGRTEYSAVFLLPEKDNIESMDDLIKRLRNKKAFTDIRDSTFPRQKVKLSLPRFKVSYGVKSLKNELKAMGIEEAFLGNKAFLEMSEDPDLYLNDVLHKAVMEVTEEGTEAAAATVGFKFLSMPAPPLVVEFNRPFLVLILHVSTGTPLFVGRIDDPEFMF